MESALDDVGVKGVLVSDMKFPLSGLSLFANVAGKKIAYACVNGFGSGKFREHHRAANYFGFHGVDCPCLISGNVGLSYPWC